jgi:hypothetical protein
MTDPDVAVQQVAKMLVPHHFVLDDAARFHFLARRVELVKRH